MGQVTLCALDQDSGARRLLEAIGDKWAILVIYALEGGTMRFNTLERSLPGVSQKMLTQTLRRLETAGFIERNVFAEVPPRVEYRLSTLGRTLEPLTSAICEWSEAHGSALAPRPPANLSANSAHL